MHVDKIMFPPEGGKFPNPTPPHRLMSKFKFKDYSAQMFKSLRKHFNIKESDYMLSICGNFNFIEFISNSKSGQFFFYSHDGRYLIKTQSRAESKFLRRIFPQYYMYMMDNPDSTIVRFLGMHRVKVPHIRRRMHFVIMNSVFCDPLNRKVHTTFDLKGSTIGRLAKPGQSVKKDLDLLNSGIKLRFGNKKDGFINQINSDAEFLRELKIMDYSLLVGIHSTAAPKSVKGTVNREGVEKSAREEKKKKDQPKLAHKIATKRSSSEKVLSTIPESERRMVTSLNEKEKTEPASPLSRHSSTGSATGSVHAYNSSDEEYYDASGPEEMEHPSLESVQFGRYGCVESCDPDGKPDGQEVYFTGIIDILQQYNFKKISENALLSTFRDGTKISAVNPTLYASRFVKFIKQFIE